MPGKITEQTTGPAIDDADLFEGVNVSDTTMDPNGSTVKWSALQIRTHALANRATLRTALGISVGTADPSGGVDGDIYIKYVP